MKNSGFSFLVLFLFSFLFFSFIIKNPAKKKATYKSSKSVSRTPKPAVAKANPYYIVIDKSDYELKVYDAEGWYATYPVVFGSKDLNDKFVAGDKKTPEGHFKV